MPLLPKILQILHHSLFILNFFPTDNWLGKNLQLLILVKAFTLNIIISFQSILLNKLNLEATFLTLHLLFE